MKPNEKPTKEEVHKNYEDAMEAFKKATISALKFGGSLLATSLGVAFGTDCQKMVVEALAASMNKSEKESGNE